jgi:MFS family permease
MMRQSAYRRYLLAVLLALLACNCIDRFALGLVLQDIKADLALSDTQLGLLTGIAFALFYSAMGIPIARWADCGNRVTVISTTAAVWSVAVALCGEARSFVQLLMLRSAVAVGEAGGFIPGSSLLADYFDRAERPRAFAIYGLGGPLSIIIGYSVGGWLNALYGWRLMFVILGTPGLVLAALARFTLREPRPRKAVSEVAAAQTRTTVRELKPSLKAVGAALWVNTTYRELLLCLSIMFFFTYGVLQWQPSFFIRSFGMTPRQVGIWFAVIYGIGGGLGTYLGGECASRYAADNERLQLRIVVIAMACCAVLSVSIYLSGNRYFALGLMGFVMFMMTASTGPFYATIQSLVPERMRAVATATQLLFANLIGMGLGPLAVGALSDALRPWAGNESLRYALLILAPGFLWAGWHAWRASNSVARDLTTADGFEDASHDYRKVRECTVQT